MHYSAIRCDEKRYFYQMEGVILMGQQILQTNLWGDLWQLEGRIDNQIFTLRENFFCFRLSEGRRGGDVFFATFLLTGLKG